MNEITYTLIADGSSDKVFLRIIKWCLDDLYPKLPTKEQYADFRTLRNPPRAGDVLGQIKYAENYYPFDICFYHRDAENTEDFSALRQLAAFNRFEQDLKRVVDNVIRLKNICV